MSFRQVLLLLPPLLGGGLVCSSPVAERPAPPAARQAAATANPAPGPCAAALVRALYPPDPNPTGPVSGPMPHELTDVNGTLYFREPEEQGGGLWQSDGTAGGTVRFRGRRATLPIPVGQVALFFEDGVLWRTDGTAAGTTRVIDFGPEPRFVSPGAQLAVDGKLFFLSGEESGRTALWRTDGTAAGTAFLRDFAGVGSSPGSLVAAGKTLYFVVDNGGPGRALWKSDGTAEGTVPVRSFTRGSATTELRDLVALGDQLLFTAVDENHVRGLWKSDGTPAGTVSLATFGPPVEAWDAAEPSHLVAVDGTLFFSVRRGGGQVLELWKSDGTADGTAFVKQLPAPDEGVLDVRAAAPLGSLFLFAVTHETGVPLASVSAQLWRSDGTHDGTFVLTEPLLTEPGAPSPTLLPLNDTVLFSARDPRPTPDYELKGQELWMTDGTRAGTALLQDIFPGPRSSYPHQLTLSGSRAFFVATDGLSGFNLWALPAACVVPLPPPPPEPGDPPALRCPTDVVVEAQGAYGAYAVYPAAIASGDATVRYDHPSGRLFPLGPTPVTATATSPKGASASCSFSVVVRDATPPTITCPPDQQVRGHRGGTMVDYPPALASDTASMPVVSYSQRSGSTFPVGTTRVVATATDPAGNTANCTFAVTVTAGALGCDASPVETLGWLVLAVAPVLLLRRRTRG